MKKNLLLKGLIFGAIAGTIDVSIMVFQNLPWTANFSAFSQWIVAGIVIATSQINLPKILKGVFISFLLLIPVAILIGQKEPFSLIPIAIITLILGTFLGWILGKK